MEKILSIALTMSMIFSSMPVEAIAQTKKTVSTQKSASSSQPEDIRTARARYENAQKTLLAAEKSYENLAKANKNIKTMDAWYDNYLKTLENSGITPHNRAVAAHLNEVEAWAYNREGIDAEEAYYVKNNVLLNDYNRQKSTVMQEIAAVEQQIAQYSQPAAKRKERKENAEKLVQAQYQKTELKRKLETLTGSGNDEKWEAYSQELAKFQAAKMKSDQEAVRLRAQDEALLAREKELEPVRKEIKEQSEKNLQTRKEYIEKHAYLVDLAPKVLDQYHKAIKNYQYAEGKLNEQFSRLNDAKSGAPGGVIKDVEAAKDLQLQYAAWAKGKCKAKTGGETFAQESARLKDCMFPILKDGDSLPSMPDFFDLTMTITHMVLQNGTGSPEEAANVLMQKALGGANVAGGSAHANAIYMQQQRAQFREYVDAMKYGKNANTWDATNQKMITDFNAAADKVDKVFNIYSGKMEKAVTAYSKFLSGARDASKNTGEMKDYIQKYYPSQDVIKDFGLNRDEMVKKLQSKKHISRVLAEQLGEMQSGLNSEYNFTLHKMVFKVNTAPEFDDLKFLQNLFPSTQNKSASGRTTSTLHVYQVEEGASPKLSFPTSAPAKEYKLYYVDAKNKLDGLKAMGLEYWVDRGAAGGLKAQGKQAALDMMAQGLADQIIPVTNELMLICARDAAGSDSRSNCAANLRSIAEKSREDNNVVYKQALNYGTHASYGTVWKESIYMRRAERFAKETEIIKTVGLLVVEMIAFEVLFGGAMAAVRRISLVGREAMAADKVTDIIRGLSANVGRGGASSTQVINASRLTSGTGGSVYARLNLADDMSKLAAQIDDFFKAANIAPESADRVLDKTAAILMRADKTLKPSAVTKVTSALKTAGTKTVDAAKYFGGVIQDYNTALVMSRRGQLSMGVNPFPEKGAWDAVRAAREAKELEASTEVVVKLSGELTDVNKSIAAVNDQLTAVRQMEIYQIQADNIGVRLSTRKMTDAQRRALQYEQRANINKMQKLQKETGLSVSDKQALLDKQTILNNSKFSLEKEIERAQKTTDELLESTQSMLAKADANNPKSPEWAKSSGVEILGDTPPATALGRSDDAAWDMLRTQQLQAELNVNTGRTTVIHEGAVPAKGAGKQGADAAADAIYAVQRDANDAAALAKENNLAVINSEIELAENQLKAISEIEDYRRLMLQDPSNAAAYQRSIDARRTAWGPAVDDKAGLQQKTNRLKTEQTELSKAIAASDNAAAKAKPVNMNGTDLINDASAATVYKKPDPVPVRFVQNETEVIVTAEGKVTAKKGSAVLRDSLGEYPVEIEKFNSGYELSHTDAAGNAFYKKKNVPVRTKEMEVPFEVNVGWQKEPLKGKPGDILAQYGPDDYGIIERGIYNKTYMNADGTAVLADEASEITNNMLRAQQEVRKTDQAVAAAKEADEAARAAAATQEAERVAQEAVEAAAKADQQAAQTALAKKVSDTKAAGSKIDTNYTMGKDANRMTISELKEAKAQTLRDAQTIERNIEHGKVIKKEYKEKINELEGVLNNITSDRSDLVNKAKDLEVMKNKVNEAAQPLLQLKRGEPPAQINISEIEEFNSVKRKYLSAWDDAGLPMPDGVTGKGISVDDVYYFNKVSKEFDDATAALKRFEAQNPGARNYELTDAVQTLNRQRHGWYEEILSQRFAAVRETGALDDAAKAANSVPLNDAIEKAKRNVNNLKLMADDILAGKTVDPGAPGSVIRNVETSIIHDLGPGFKDKLLKVIDYRSVDDVFNPRRIYEIDAYASRYQKEIEAIRKVADDIENYIQIRADNGFIYEIP